MTWTRWAANVGEAVRYLVAQVRDHAAELELINRRLDALEQPGWEARFEVNEGRISPESRICPTATLTADSRRTGGPDSGFCPAG